MTRSQVSLVRAAAGNRAASASGIAVAIPDGLCAHANAAWTPNDGSNVEWAADDAISEWATGNDASTHAAGLACAAAGCAC